MSDLHDLLARVEAATAPDRALDDAICLACGWTRHHVPHPAYRHGPYWHDPSGKLYGEVSPQITASLNAALALVERVLPGWTWSVGNVSAGGHAYIMREGGALHGGKAASPALALLAALLRALIEAA